MMKSVINGRLSHADFPAGIYRSDSRSDNSLKNHFYSRLRKILRKINAVIEARFKKKFKPIQLVTIYKIVEAVEEQFK